jgi:hypothetical protein
MQELMKEKGFENKDYWQAYQQCIAGGIG